MASASVIDFKHGLSAVELETDFLRLIVLPEVGAKIYDLQWKEKNRTILWHNPRVPPQRFPFDANFDNYWCGGWDEGFPTCDPCEYAGEQYPALGELRSLRWEVENFGSRDGGASVKLSAFGPISPILATKTITLRSDSPLVNVKSEITNLGPKPLDFIWGSHPALQVNEHMVLRIPAKKGIVAQASDELMGRPGQQYNWPHLETAQGKVDMSHVQGINAAVNGGHYALELDQGFYAVEDVRSGEGFLLQWPLEQCPYLWMWLVYGGWRGHHHVILEPWTSYPNTLRDAVAGKTHRNLAAGETFSIELNATVYAKPEKYLNALKRVEIGAY
jgi:galactose mutarotase-like enzyme